jgi:hypothetical protein
MSEVTKLYEPIFKNLSWNFELDQTDLYAFLKEECQTV